MTLREKIDAAPTKPGSYVFRDARGKVLYVGKTISLRKRLHDWFSPSKGGHSPWSATMLKRVGDIEYTVVASEAEALVLEWNLIREHEPQFNIRLADDKSYPYLKLTTDEEYPRLVLVRELPRSARPSAGRTRNPRAYQDPKQRVVHRQSKGRYFGPYTSTRSMRRVMRMAGELFGLRPCRHKIDPSKQPPPCLDRHIHRCAGPCNGSVTKEEYAEVVRQVELFLEGKTDEVERDLEQEMQAASESLNFERAARYRDKLEAVRRVTEQQKVIAGDAARDQDVIAAVVSGDRAAVQRLCIRRGKLIDQEQHILIRAMDRSPADVLAAFLTQYYARATHVPREVLLNHQTAEMDALASALTELRGSNVTVACPQRGEKRRLTEMATENAVNGLNALESTEAEHARIGRQTLWELAETLSLEEGPARIECYDISNIQGHMATGSMVVAVDGWPASSAYRRFRIKQGEGEPNDYAMMREVMSRRFAAAEAENEKFLPLPNLIVVDGGKGQLNVALDVLAESGHTDIAVVGLAKEHEHVYVPGRSDPVPMAECVRGHRLLMRIRDEAHRFAITHHREIRAKRARKSVLDEAPGIGPKRKRELVKTFRSVARLREATVDEIGKVRGMSRRSAEALKQYLEETMSDRPSK